MNANTDLIIDLDQWLLENTREPKAPFRAGSTLHRLNISNGHFYKEIGSCVTYKGRDLEEGSLVYTLYDQETLTRKVGAAIYLPGERVVIGQEGTIAFNMDAAHKQFVIACLAAESLKLAETGYPVACASVEGLCLTLPEDIAILDGVELFKDAPVAEMKPQQMRTIINNAFAEVKQANIQKQAANVESGCIPLNAPVNPHGFPHMSEKGKPLNTWENLAYLLGQYGISARYNVISKKIEVLIPGHASSIDNKQKATLAEVTSLCARNSMPKTEIAQYLVIISDRNQYNPVLSWVNSRAWDGVSRFADLADTIVPDDNYPLEMRDILLKRWLISAMAAAANTGGFTAHGALVLVGAQGTGKTTWFNNLVCPELRRELVLTGALLDTENKDTIITAVSHWICELGELDATFRKADIAKLKAFITQGVDKFRRPFEREDDERDRRTIFCASVNQSDYLVDDTGNRRWWTIPAKKIDYMHTIDVQQLWAEVYEWYKAGERWHLTDEEQAQLRTINESHEQIDPIAEKIREVCTAPDARTKGQDWMIPGDVLAALGYRTPNKTQRNIAAKALQDLGFECRVRHKVKQYLVPGGLKSQFSEPNQDIPF